MKIPVLAFGGLLFSQLVDASVQPRRTRSILNNPDAQPDLPSLKSAEAAAALVGLNLDNIQGDILVGMKKRKELFFFFQINSAAVKTFKQVLARDVHPRITTATQLLSVSTQPLTAVNIAFSNSGLSTLGITDNVGDFLFSLGQDSTSSNLGDPGTANWVPGFRGTLTHGVLLLASDTVANVNAELGVILAAFGPSIIERHRLLGEARPGTEEGHEHFGFMDGISQPAVRGFNTPLPGQSEIDPGRFILKAEGDFNTRPDWTADGSFLAFRQLKQLVPEFNTFLNNNPLTVPGLTRQQNVDLLGARMVGRWKSGAPIDLAPRFDDPVLASNPNLNNNFNFAHPGEDLTSNQTRCPFSAHIRKTRPRADFQPENTFNHILRSGIPYGPEVTPQEATSGVSSTTATQERGLAFVSYQSDISSGFAFMQQTWANSASFVFGKNDPTPGVDPIIGVDPGAGGFGSARTVSGLDPLNPNRDLQLRDFIVSRGGEYFLSPSLSAILDPIAKVADDPILSAPVNVPTLIQTSLAAPATAPCLFATSNTDGSPVVISACGTRNAVNIKWTVIGGGAIKGATPAAAGPITQIRVFGNKCLDVTEGNNADGVALQIWTCFDGNTNQLWRVNGDGTISWANHNKCVDVRDGRLTAGTVAQTWTCAAGNRNQVWAAAPPSP